MTIDHKSKNEKKTKTIGTRIKKKHEIKRYNDPFYKGINQQL